MLFFDGGVGLAFLALYIFCILDVITSDEGSIRNLPKITWLFLVILIPDIGAIAWLIAGRPQRSGANLPYRGNKGIPAEYDRPGRASAYSPDDDAAFLQQLKERAEQQRKTAHEEAERIRKAQDEPPKP